MMNIVEMRKQVMWAYSGAYQNTPWNAKVRKMTDQQVKALYFKLKIQGKLK